jgi:3-deoxy-manno-octulosonate cytidylyltransferase (CMP-KDO synthetase)
VEIAAVIPARYGATRLPGKPLREIDGKPMIEHVYRRTSGADNLDGVIVATDDERVYKAVEEFGGQVVMTSPDHQTGTDRLAEAAQEIEAEIIVNVQGDEPLIVSDMIDEAVQPLIEDQSLKMSTLKHELSAEEADNPDIVKVVTDKDDTALYFSRAKIPYSRQKPTKYYKHIGLYVYRREFLFTYTDLDPTYLEKKEKLEQLRALENGYRIKVVETKHDTIGVDTEKDLIKVRKIMSD